MIKLPLYVVAIVFLLISCKNNIQSEIKPISKKAIPQLELKTLMVSSGQNSPYTDIIYDNCSFQLVQNTDGDTVYLSTNDFLFSTPEGYVVGDKWETITKFEQKSIKRMPGWGYYLELKSGWNLGFCEGQSCTDEEPTIGSNIKWIFKRNRTN